MQDARQGLVSWYGLRSIFLFCDKNADAHFLLIKLFFGKLRITNILYLCVSVFVVFSQSSVGLGVCSN